MNKIRQIGIEALIKLKKKKFLATPKLIKTRPDYEVIYLMEYKQQKYSKCNRLSPKRHMQN